MIYIEYLKIYPPEITFNDEYIYIYIYIYIYVCTYGHPLLTEILIHVSKYEVQLSPEHNTPSMHLEASRRGQ